MTMTYTLAMAAEQGIEISKDGVAEVAMTKARAALTSLIRAVRWGGRAGAFTERGERVAFVVSPEVYEQAIRDREVLEQLELAATAPRGLSIHNHAEVTERARVIREALDEAKLHADG